MFARVAGMGALRPRRRPSSTGRTSTGLPRPRLLPLLLLPALVLVLARPVQGQLFSSLVSNDILRPLRQVSTRYL